MALKKPFEPLALFSMSSMTDVIFLLLIFFMVTSSLIFPSAIDVNLPDSSNQTTTKPVTEVYIDSLNNISIVENRTDSLDEAKRTPMKVDIQGLASKLADIHAADSLRTVALFADKSVEYGNVVDVLDVAAKQNLKMVLATRVSQSSVPTDGLAGRSENMVETQQPIEASSGAPEE